MSMSKASLLSVSIGPLLLKGWTLTDSACKNPGCGAPRLRPPNSSQLLCPACDSENLDGPSATAATAGSSPTTSQSTLSRVSTPLTEESRPQSPDFQLPADTPEMIARRETTDRASSEIGRRLLQGWAMLGDECPNESCYGTPLMRPPPVAASAGKNPRKECVVCGRVYISERDAAAMAHSAPEPAPASDEATTRVVPVAPVESAPTSARLELPDDPRPVGSPPASSLRATAESLEAALQRMASHLAGLSTPTGSSLDVRAIAETADAISKAAEALGKDLSVNNARTLG